MSRRRTVFALLLIAFAVGGCANKEAVVHEARTEGIYLDVGELDYQVQISRQLNPAIVPDDSYVKGIPDHLAELDDDETWFVVFVRVQNQTKEAHPAAEDFEIIDTQEKVYRPIAIDTEANPFQYKPRVVPPGDLIPKPDSVAATNSAQGAMLLFKLTLESLGNRPLEFKITPPDGGQPAVVDLDV